MVKARSRVSGVVLVGPLAQFSGAFQDELRARGYTPRSTAPQLRQVGRLSCWLEEQALTAGELDELRVEEFLVVQRAAGRPAQQRHQLVGAVRKLPGRPVGVAGICSDPDVDRCHALGLSDDHPGPGVNNHHGGPGRPRRPDRVGPMIVGAARVLP